MENPSLEAKGPPSSDAGAVRTGVPRVAALFVLHHLAYGMGTLAGIGGLLRNYRKIKNYRHPTL